MSIILVVGEKQTYPLSEGLDPFEKPASGARKGRPTTSSLTAKQAASTQLKHTICIMHFFCSGLST
jgi:hypothetical protein